MTFVEELKYLSDKHADGSITKQEFERLRAELLESVETAEEAPPQDRRGVERRQPVQDSPEPAIMLMLIALCSILPGLVAMLAFGLPLWSGATIFVVFLGGLTWLWARSLPDAQEGEEA